MPLSKGKPGNGRAVGMSKQVTCTRDESKVSTKSQNLLRDALISALTDSDQIPRECPVQFGYVLPTALVLCAEAVVVRALFDQGAQISLIRKSLTDELKLEPVRKTFVALAGILGAKQSTYYNVVEIVIELGQDAVRCDLIIVEDLPAQFTAHGLKAAAEELRREEYQLADNYASDVVSDIQILIGCNHYFSFIDSYTQFKGYHLLKSAAGYLISGPVGTEALLPFEGLHSCNLVVDILENGDPGLEPTALLKLWDLDTIGIKSGELSLEEQVANRLYENSTVFENGQYWVRLPLRDNIQMLPTNEARARACARSLLKRLRLKPHHLEAYDAYLQQMLDNRFIEEVPDNAKTTGLHYLPHLPVMKDSLSTPLRVVFNASSKAAEGLSLNDCLLKGPNMTEKLADALMNFRTRTFGFSADISKAFLRIGLQEQDRDYTRFYWARNPIDPESGLKILRFKSVLFGATCSPYLLLATLDLHLNRSKHPLASKLKGLFYMDNMVGTAETEEEIKELYQAAKVIMAEGNFPLQQWATNNVGARSLMLEQADDPEMELGVLGYMWEVETDEIKVKRPAWTDIKMTKRNLLRLVSTIFDPLGLISPLTIPGRMLMQQAHKLKVDWDDELPSSFVADWKTILKEIEDPSDIPFPRAAVRGGSDSELHVFCDASAKAYGAAVYLVNQEAKLVTSRARVSPLEVTTIPKLELLSVLIAAKLVKYVIDTLTGVTFTRAIIWSDSECSIQWVKNNQSGMIFVRNQVDKIQAIRNAYPFSLYHVSSKDNPADLLSRGTTKGKLLAGIWRKGPTWLTKPADWPTQKEQVAIFELTTELLPRATKPVVPLAVFDETSVSSWGSLMRKTRTVLQAANLFAGKELKLNPAYYWFRKVQAEHFPLIVAILRDQLRVPQNNPSCIMINQLGLYWEGKEGLIRCQGRLDKSDLSPSAKRPVLLPAPAHITTLFIMLHHTCGMHDGTNGTLASLKQQVWIPKGRAAVKKVLKKCISCVKKTKAVLNRPGPPDLPVERVTLTRAFEHVGVDYSGHILIKDPYDNNRMTKAYICLFTCMASRAVHLELARDLSAEVFLNLFIRFVYEYGVPSVMVSDNGTNFVAAEAALMGIQADMDVRDYVQRNGIRWKFIRPRAPWEGGFYERLVGIVKKTLYKVMNRQTLTWDALATLLKGAQTCVNNRPLTYVSSDEPLEMPLTPNHLVKGQRIDLFPPTECPGDGDPDFHDPDKLRKTYDQSVTLRRKFANLWAKDYLTALRQRHRVPSSDQRLDLEVGDVVLVESDETRDYWPLGRIEQLLEDDRKQIRAAKVLMKGRSVEKTINRLVPLEVNRRHREDAEPAGASFEHAWEGVGPGGITPQTESGTPDPEGIQEEEENIPPNGSVVQENSTSPSPATGARKKPRRTAALKALDKFQAWGERGEI